MATPTPHLTLNHLSCKKYSDLPQSSEQKAENVHSSYKLIVDEQNNMFVQDKSSKLISELPYNDNKVIQIATGWKHCVWHDFSVQNKRLYLLISECQPRTQQFVRALIVQSLDSDVQQIIYLDAYKTLAETVVVNRGGMIYVSDRYDDAVYIDTDLQAQPLKIKTVSYNSDAEIVSGWDGNLYTYSYDYAYEAVDELTNWGNVPLLQNTPVWTTSDVISPRYKSELEIYKELLGIDTTGRFYFHSFGEYKPSAEPQPKGHFIRLSTKSNQVEIGQLPDGLVLSTFTFTIAPNGILYGITYDMDDSNRVPEILQCAFDSK